MKLYRKTKQGFIETLITIGNYKPKSWSNTISKVLKRNILIFLLLLFISSCDPILLNKNEYRVLDTIVTYENQNNRVIVLVKQDSTLHSALLNKKGELININFKQLKYVKFKK